MKSPVFLENLRHEGTIPIQAWLYAGIDALVGVAVRAFALTLMPNSYSHSQLKATTLERQACLPSVLFHRTMGFCDLIQVKDTAYLNSEFLRF